MLLFRLFRPSQGAFLGIFSILIWGCHARATPAEGARSGSNRGLHDGTLPADNGPVGLNIARFNAFVVCAILARGRVNRECADLKTMAEKTITEGLKGEPMRLLIAGLALAAMMASAQAQVGGQQTQINAASGVGQHAAAASAQGDKAAEAGKLKANDKAYNAALRNLPDKQYDPWHGVR